MIGKRGKQVAPSIKQKEYMSETKTKTYDVIVEPGFYLKFTGIEATSENEAAAIATKELLVNNGNVMVDIPTLKGQRYFAYAILNNEDDVYSVEVEDVQAETYNVFSTFGVSGSQARPEYADLGIDYAYIDYIADNIKTMPLHLVRETVKSIGRRYGYFNYAAHEEEGRLLPALSNIAYGCAADGYHSALKIVAHFLKEEGMIPRLPEQKKGMSFLERMARRSSCLYNELDFLHTKSGETSPYHRYAKCIELLDSYGLIKLEDITQALKILKSKPNDINPELKASLDYMLLRYAANNQGAPENATKHAIHKRKM